MSQLGQSMATQPRTRPATESDAAHIASLCAQLGYPSSTKQIAQRLSTLLRQSNHGIYLVERPEATSPSGVIHVTINEELLDESVAEICTLIIDEQVRGLGFGKALINVAEQWARSRQLNQIRVRSNVIRNEAHSFYQRLGYSVVKQQTFFRKKLASEDSSE